MGIYTEAVQKLYVAYFSRPADRAGLEFWEGVVTAAKGSTAAVSAAFAASQEYKDTYAGLNNTQIVNTIYNNLFGRDAEPAGLLFWANALSAKAITVDNMVATIASAAQTTDATAFANKVAVATAFTAALDTTAEILAYSGTAANAAAKAFLATITTNATADAALAPGAIDAAVIKVTTPVPVDVNVALTAGVDNLIGTANNESIAGNDSTYTGLDKIDGGLGNDTLVLSDVAGGALEIADATVINVESLQLTSTGAMGGNAADLSAWTGLTSATIVTKTALGQTVTAAKTTDLSLSNTGAADYTVVGGEDVSIKSGGIITVTGNGGLKTLAITGGSTVTVNDSADDTLTTVSLNGNTAAASITSDKLASLSLTNSTQATTIVAAAGTRTLDVKMNGSTGAINDATATTVALTVGTSAATTVLNAAAAKTVTIAGDKGITLNLTGAAAVTAITSTTTGGVTMTSALGNGVAFTSAGGADTISVGATTKAIVTGAGDDSVTVTAAALGSGGSIAAGDGTDMLTMTALHAATASAGTTFAAAISGFEKLTVDAVAASSTANINLANLDNINYVVTAGSAAGSASSNGTGETTEVTVTGTASDADQVIFDGTTIQLADGDTAAAAATKIAAGVYTNYTVTAVGAVLTVTNKAVGNAVDLTAPAFSFVDGAATGKPALPTVVTTQQGITDVAAVPATSEVQNMLVAGTSTGPITFLGAAVAGTVGGQVAADVILAIVADKANVIAVWNAANPARELLDIADGLNDSLDLTFKDTEGDVALMSGAISNGTSFGNATQTTPGNLETTLVVGAKETFTAQFTTPANGADTIVFDGVTITLADGDTAAQIATKVDAGAFPNWAAVAVGDTVTFTAAANGAQVDKTSASFTINDVTTGTGTQGVTVGTIVPGTPASVGTAGALVLTDLANNGTVEITGAGTFTVNVKDAAAGATDVLNLVVKGASAYTTGVVTAANVETVKITTVDTDTTTHVDTVNLVATSATTVTVSGNSGINLDSGTSLAKVTLMDASGVSAGVVTYTQQNATGGTIKGGAGADMLTGAAGADIIDGGAGNDIIDGKGGVNTLTGGAGNDAFTFTVKAESAVKASTITGLNAGDTIVLTSAITDADGKMGTAVTGLDTTTAVFQDFVDASVAAAALNNVAWFQFGGNTYIVHELTNESATFTNGEDMIVKITGNVDLSAATIAGSTITIV